MRDVREVFHDKVIRGNSDFRRPGSRTADHSELIGPVGICRSGVDIDRVAIGEFL